MGAEKSAVKTGKPLPLRPGGSGRAAGLPTPARLVGVGALALVAGGGVLLFRAWPRPEPAVSMVGKAVAGSETSAARPEGTRTRPPRLAEGVGEPPPHAEGVGASPPSIAGPELPSFGQTREAER